MIAFGIFPRCHQSNVIGDTCQTNSVPSNSAITISTATLSTSTSSSKVCSHIPQIEISGGGNFLRRTSNSPSELLTNGNPMALESNGIPVIGDLSSSITNCVKLGNYTRRDSGIPVLDIGTHHETFLKHLNAIGDDVRKQTDSIHFDVTWLQKHSHLG